MNHARKRNCKIHLPAMVLDRRTLGTHTLTYLIFGQSPTCNLRVPALQSIDRIGAGTQRLLRKLIATQQVDHRHWTLLQPVVREPRPRRHRARRRRLGGGGGGDDPLDREQLLCAVTEAHRHLARTKQQYTVVRGACSARTIHATLHTRYPSVCYGRPHVIGVRAPIPNLAHADLHFTYLLRNYLLPTCYQLADCLLTTDLYIATLRTPTEASSSSITTARSGTALRRWRTSSSPTCSPVP
jgi:hypothetical protein